MGDIYPFVVSAPGKTIVFGEHAVVHGKAAIAAAISLRSYLLVTPNKTGEKITLNFPDVGLVHTWSAKELPWKAFNNKYHHEDRVTSLDQTLVEELQPLIDQVSPSVSEHARKIHQSAALTFLYLLLSLSNSEVPPCDYTLRSTIPIASGLGSSASISVCIATAFLTQTKRLSGPSDRQSREEIEKNLETINKWAFVGEVCIHGTPSGVDNTVATRGRAVKFQRLEGGQPPRVTPIHEFPVLPLLITDTNQARSTATEVAKVKTLMGVHPKVTELILDAIGNITESVFELISENFDPKHSASLQKLGELVRMNHGLLVSLGVSHPKLERIRELIDHAGIGWTKLTGAGAGGCAITILKNDTTPEALHKLEADVTREGFGKYETLLGGVGVGIYTPSQGDQSNEKFSQEAFLSAKTAEDVEGIVGTKARPWKFWD